MQTIAPQYLASKVNLIQVGREKTPVIIIDDFSPEPQLCINLAIKKIFKKENLDERSLFPGVRALMGSEYGNTVLEGIDDIVRHIYNIPNSLNLHPHRAYYSLINTPEEKLSFLQSIPHYDSAYKHDYAALHYLNPGDFGGTSFYRHNPTGFEKISEERLKTYLEVRNNHSNQQASKDLSYITESTEHYKLIGKLAYKPNRLVIYPGSLLHSAFINDAQRDLSDNPRTGRLTANFFIYYQ